MNKQLFSIFTSSILTLVSLFGIPTTAAYAIDEDTIIIYIDEAFDTIENIDQNPDFMNLYLTMTGEGLINLNSEGYFVPGLAESWRILPSSDDNGDGDGNDESYEGIISVYENLDFPDWPESWLDTEKPLGWESIPPDTILNWEQNPSLEFLDGPGPLRLQFNLRDNIKSADGDNFNAYDLRNFIYNAQSLGNWHIKKHWDCVQSFVSYTEDDSELPPDFEIEVKDDHTIVLSFDFSKQTYGFMDFMYGLTEPIGRINNLNNDSESYALGAYKLSSYTEDEVRLTRNEYWYQGTAPTKNIIFKYSDSPEIKAANGDGDIFVFDSENDNANIPASLSKHAVTSNPLILRFSSTLPYGSDINIRKAISCAVDRSYLTSIYNDTLKFSSNGIWAVKSDDFEADIFYYLNKSQNFNLYAPLDMTLLVSEENEYHKALAYRLKETLSYYNIVIHIVEAPNTMYTHDNDNTYDLIITEIDLLNTNSAYNRLYGNVNFSTDINLELIKKSANASTYATMNAVVQAENLAALANIVYGWRTKTVVLNEDITGFVAPSGFNPTNDISRMDFRYVVKN